MSSDRSDVILQGLPCQLPASVLACGGAAAAAACAGRNAALHGMEAAAPLSTGAASGLDPGGLVPMRQGVMLRALLQAQGLSYWGNPILASVPESCQVDAFGFQRVRPLVLE